MIIKNAARRLFAKFIAFGSVVLVSNALATQMTYLDFDSGTDGSIVYTAAMRDAVQAKMEEVYGDYDFAFTQSAPVAGDFSTVTFNAGGTGGLASGIDFLNLNKNDTAVVNVDGLGFVTEADLISSTAFIGAHELGHLLGLRHYNSLGAIGQGAPPGFGSGLFPGFPGPSGALETYNNVMASPASTGQPLSAITEPFSLSARSSIKLAYNEQGVSQTEMFGFNDDIATADLLVLEDIDVANTSLATDSFFGKGFDVSATAMFGSLGSNDTMDVFAFEADANSFFSFEVISSVNSNNLNPFDTQISIFDSLGNFVDYFGTSAFNDDETESLDSFLFDLQFDTAGTYYAKVGSFQNSGEGDYALFVNQFSAFNVPEPTTLAILLAGLAGLRLRRR